MKILNFSLAWFRISLNIIVLKKKVSWVLENKKSHQELTSIMYIRAGSKNDFFELQQMQMFQNK